MKRILFVFHDSEPLSGATASLLDLLDGIIKIGDVEVCALIPNTKHGLSEVLRGKGINFYEKRYFNSRYVVSSNIFVRFFQWGKSLFKTVLTFISAIEFSIPEYNFDLIYSNTSAAYMGSFISIIKHKKHIWHIREFGLQDQNRKHCISEPLFKKYATYISDHIIFISNSLQKNFVIKDEHCNTSVIYNDISFNKFSSKDKKFNLNNKLSLLIVGTLCKGKGQKEVIAYVKLLKDQGIEVKLGIVGSDNNKFAIKLKKQVELLSLNENVEFLGFCHNMEEIRKQYDVAIISSISEAFGRVTIEAMLSKMLVVARNSGANVELIESGKTGFLYEDESSFIEIIKHLNFNRAVIEELSIFGYKSAIKYTEGTASREINKIIVNM